MLTLSQATSETRTALKWGGVVLLGLFLLLILFRVGGALKGALFPTPTPPPTVSFGKLPQIIFPSNASGTNFDYSLNTLTGALPVFPNKISVYKISPVPPDLLALQKSRAKVAAAGFQASESAISNNVYSWNDGSSLNRTITMNIFTSNFSLSSSFTEDPFVQSATNLPDTATAISTAQSFLSGMSSFPDDIDTSKTKTFLFSLNNNTLTSASSFSNTQVIEVDFFQKNINNLPIYYPKAVNSTMSVLVVGGQDQPQVAQINYFHQNISNQSATYPIITAQTAFDELKQGKGYIASYFGSSDYISITNVSLGYYMGDKAQAYLMPVAVFQGDNGFYAYVPLITDAWVSK